MRGLPQEELRPLDINFRGQSIDFLVIRDILVWLGNNTESKEISKVHKQCSEENDFLGAEQIIRCVLVDELPFRRMAQVWKL
jgi:hypothetical protein